MLRVSVFSEVARKLCISICAAFLCALSMNLFLVPAHVYAAGINGAAQLLSDIVHDGLHIHLSIGLLVLTMNLPIAVLGWFRVGKSFTLFSFITVVLTSFFLTVLPVYPLSSDILLNSIFGGMISAVGVGMALKYGISTGGLDIIAIYLTRRNRNASSGKYFLILNGIIIVIAGAVYEWQFALYTLISRFVNSYVIDMIHTKYQKLTVLTVTDQAERMTEAIQDQFDRGMTVIPSFGGFTGTEKSTLMVVISHYELYKIERLIKAIDPDAFTNILETNKVIGTFHNEEQQRAIQAMKHGVPAQEARKTLGLHDYEYFEKLFKKPAAK
ncbi:YitT family protein [Sporolactobacillus sp. CPB3-1]|uniref:YitT family protein n=1 Tax=Sporolactobacillus mangiferae TaxID=2940498 RepID=A0ABT0M842_9BACL|nr:YitT family protein [Sporolactobacillus mangiferae]MCL1631032.1 YitT family protein [Sporolactobacillus mangiferae]